MEIWKMPKPGRLLQITCKLDRQKFVEFTMVFYLFFWVFLIEKKKKQITTPMMHVFFRYRAPL